MSSYKKEKLLIVKEAKRLLKKNALEYSYGKFVALTGICGYLFMAAKNSNFKEHLAYSIIEEDLVKYKPSDKGLAEYWWPPDLEHVPVRQEVLNKLIAEYSTPWYKRLFNLFKN